MTSTKGRREQAARIEQLEAKLKEVELAAKIAANIAATFYAKADSIAAMGELAGDWQREQAQRDTVIAECHAHDAGLLFDALGIDELPASVRRYREALQLKAAS